MTEVKDLSKDLQSQTTDKLRKMLHKAHQYANECQLEYFDARNKAQDIANEIATRSHKETLTRSMKSATMISDANEEEDV